MLTTLQFSHQALEKYNIEKDIAAFIKKEFDKKYNPTWHCIVGRNFGSYVTHETKHFIYFYLGQVAVLLFKSGQLEPTAGMEKRAKYDAYLQKLLRRSVSRFKTLLFLPYRSLVAQLSCTSKFDSHMLSKKC